jgi:hypothetical protein
MPHLRLRFVVLVVAAAVVAGAGSQSAHAITWCFDWVAFQIDEKHADQNRLSVDQLRAKLRKLGYEPVLQIKATAPTAGDVVRWYDIKLDVTQLASGEKLDKMLKKDDVVIFGNDHTGIVTANRRAADARIDHFLQVPDRTGTCYSTLQATTLPNYFVGPGKNWSLRQMFAVSREQPPVHTNAFPADDWTTSYYTEWLGRLVFGAPRQYPFLGLTAVVWRRTSVDLTVHSANKFSWKHLGSSAPTGSATMVRAGTRKTSAAQPRCEKSGTSQQPKPKGAAGSFVLTGSRVVENPYGKEVTIDTGGNASWNRCCDGATWKTQYTWKVPSTLIPGKPFSISISLKTLEVVPRQPLLDQMSALAPDFRQDLQTQYIGHPSNSKTYSVPFSEGFRTDPNIKEVKVYISFAHASVEYTYRRVGG